MNHGNQLFCQLWPNSFTSHLGWFKLIGVLVNKLQSLSNITTPRY